MPQSSSQGMMMARGRRGTMRGRSRAAAVCVLAMLLIGGAAGCGSRSANVSPGAGGAGLGTGAARGPVTRCGTARTAAGVPVDIEIQGRAACGDALAVERAYARALASGKVRGNGGGAPVTIRGWVCQGFATPEVLATGRASACRKGTARILAILPSQSPSPAAS
jgi:hypothetical protein